MNHMNGFPIPFILDGATGTELIRRGMKPGECTEAFVLENPEVMRALQAEYFAAGADAVLAPTFGANIPALKRHGFAAEEADEICRRLVAISMAAADEENERDRAGKRYVGGDVSPTGLLPEPFGDVPADEIIEIFKKQISALVSSGVDFLMLETMISLSELRLAVIAAREVSADIPIFAALTVNKNGRTMNGDRLDASLMILAQYGIQGFGVNCSIGPDVVYDALVTVAPIAKKLGIPLIAKPNAGLPIDGGSTFSVKPDDMAEYTGKFLELGAYILGGCCGTSPAHIAAIRNAGNSYSYCNSDCDSDNKAEADLYKQKFVATSRVIAEIPTDAPYITITSDEDDVDMLYNIVDSADPDEVICLDLQDGAAKQLILMDAYIQNPICVRGKPNEVRLAMRYLCRKII